MITGLFTKKSHARFPDMAQINQIILTDPLLLAVAVAEVVVGSDLGHPLR